MWSRGPRVQVPSLTPRKPQVRDAEIGEHPLKPRKRANLRVHDPVIPLSFIPSNVSMASQANMGFCIEPESALPFQFGKNQKY